MHIMICVTSQRTCERLIRHGAHLLNGHEGELSVVHVVKTGETFLGQPDDAQALEYLYGVARQHEADLTVVRASDVIKALVKRARELEATHIVMGRGPNDDILWEMERRLTDVGFEVV